MNGDDLLFAINSLGFDPYVEPLRLFLLKYRECGGKGGGGAHDGGT